MCQKVGGMLKGRGGVEMWGCGKIRGRVETLGVFMLKCRGVP